VRGVGGQSPRPPQGGGGAQGTMRTHTIGRHSSIWRMYVGLCGGKTMKKTLGMKRENLGLGGTEIEKPSCQWQRLIPTSHTGQ
jgi:hypothetical protein